MRVLHPARVLGAIFVLGTLAIAGEKPVKAPPFVPVWQDAVSEAKALNLPLVIHRHGFY